MILTPKEPLSCVALVVAAGRGNRFGGNIPKQYVKLNGISLLKRSLEALLSNHNIQNML